MSTHDQSDELKFRSWNFRQTFVKFISIMKSILICFDTKCEAILADREWIIDILFNIQMKKMQTTLKIKSIKSITHESMKYVCILVHFSKTTKDDKTTLVFIIEEIHFVNDLKIKMFIENEFLNSKDFVTNIEVKDRDDWELSNEYIVKDLIKEFLCKKNCSCLTRNCSTIRGRTISSNKSNDL